MTRPWLLRGWRLALIGTFAFVASGLMLAQDQETLTVKSPSPADDERFAEYVASLVGAPV
jgi:hypothetical protein